MSTSALIKIIYPVIQAHANGLGLPVVWLNTSHTPTENHVRVQVMNVRPRQLTVCSEGALHQHLVQLSYYSETDMGVIKPLEVVEGLAELFPFGYMNQGYTTLNAPAISSPIPVEAWYTQAVTFTFSNIS